MGKKAVSKPAHTSSAPTSEKGHTEENAQLSAEQQIAIAESQFKGNKQEYGDTGVADWVQSHASDKPKA